MKAHRKRAAKEPLSVHFKTDHRLGRKFYKGIVGNKINNMLTAAAFNFKRVMIKWKASFCQFFQELYNIPESARYTIVRLQTAILESNILRYQELFLRFLI
jgi:IS5 family transposase